MSWHLMSVTAKVYYFNNKSAYTVQDPRSTVQYSFLKYNFWCNFTESVWANGGKVTDDQG